MASGLTQTTLNCPQVGKEVRIDQTEQQCRCQHGCNQPVCPLGDAFSLQFYDQLINQMWKQGYGS